MIKTQFTPKLIVISLITFIISLGLLSGLWVILNGSMMKAKKALDVQVSTLTTSIASLETEQHQAAKQKKLVSSQIVRGAPAIPNGIDMAQFLTDLDSFVLDNQMTLKTTSYSPKLLYPMAKGNALAGAAPSSLYQMAVKFELIGNSEADCQAFLKKLETDTRYLTITALTYNANPSNASYELLLSFSMVYLSEYDTFKPITEKE